MDNLLFIINVVSPVFLLVIAGALLKWWKLIDDVFVNITSKFVFNVSLPVLIFMKLYDVDLSQMFDIGFNVFVVVATTLVFIMGWIAAKFFTSAPEDEGVFAQGAFRGNYAIVSLAIISRMFDAATLSKATLALVFVLPLYNILSIIGLIVPFNQGRSLNIKGTALEVLMNPLILAVFAAMPFAILSIPLPDALVVTGDHLASIALPLALIGIGGSLKIESVKSPSVPAVASSVLKILISPLLVIIAAYYLGFRQEDLGIFFIMFAGPTAIASFIMSAVFKGNIKLAGEIIVLTTLGCIFLLTLGLYLLKELTLI